MDFEFTNFLNKVATSIAPSGNERLVTQIWESEIKEYVTDIYHAPLGNTIAFKKGSGDKNKKKIMISAHADEIGLMITYIDDKGFLYFNIIGGVDISMLPGRTVSIEGKGDKIIRGVIGAKPIHLKEVSDNNANISSDNLWIDINASNKKDAEKLVRIGCVATLLSDFNVQGSRFIGKAMDNRCSMAVLLSLAKDIEELEMKNDIFFVATTQEEIRARGAQTVAVDIEPDICIVLDVTHATDYPSVSPLKDGDIRLGAGAVIAVGPNMDRTISQKLISLAEDKNIEYQIEAHARATGTDANTIQIAGKGTNVGLISIPCRYMHSPVEIVDKNDMMNVKKLLNEFLIDINK